MNFPKSFRSGPVLVLSPNPCIDAEWKTDGVLPEEKNTIQSERRWAGGKGVNVARWLGRLGVRSVVLLPLGGATGLELKHHFLAEKLGLKSVPIHGETRTNVLITPHRGPQYRFNARGPELSAGEHRRVVRAASEFHRKSGLQVLSGSLPRGTSANFYAQLIRLGRKRGVLSALDCDGEALEAAVVARPFLIKPNEFALRQWAGTVGRSESTLLAAAHKMSMTAHGWVLVSRGAKGALLVNAREKVELAATVPKVAVLNTLGAGDALLAGAVSQIVAGRDPVEWLRLGVASGTAAAQMPAGLVPSMGKVRQVLASVRAGRWGS